MEGGRVENQICCCGGDSAGESTVNCPCRRYLERMREEKDILIYDLNKDCCTNGI